MKILGANQSSGNTPPKKIERKVDYSNVTIDEAKKRELEYLRQWAEIKNNEVMSIMGNDRRILGTWEGTKNGITIGLDKSIMKILEKSVDNTIIVMHTHPDNLSFSMDDIEILYSYRSIYQLWVIGLDNVSHCVSIESGFMPKNEKEKDEIREFSKRLNLELLKKTKESIARGEKTEYEAVIDWIDEKNRRLAYNYKWRYY